MKKSILFTAMALTVAATGTNPVLSGFNHLSRPADARMLSTGTTVMRGDLGSGSLFISPVQRAEEARTTFGVNFIPTMVAGQPNSMMGTAYGSSGVGNGILSGALRYYQAGSVLARDNDGNELGTITPYVFDFAVNYSLPLSERLTMGAGLRYVFSDLYQGQENSAKSSSVNVDLAWLLSVSENSDLMLQLSEVGPKMNSENGASGFSPTRFRLAYLSTAELGGRDLNWSVQIEKILAPTAPIMDASGAVISGRAIPTSFIAPIFTSWADAPGGLTEEFSEFRPSFGLSYDVTDAIALRTGYSYQPIDKGSLNYLGLGFSYRTESVRFDAGYAIGLAALTNPMNNHIQMGLSYSL